MPITGSKPYIIAVNGSAYEVEDEKRALAEAEKQAHQHQTDVYIFKAVKKVAPKRDVSVTEL